MGKKRKIPKPQQQLHQQNVDDDSDDETLQESSWWLARQLAIFGDSDFAVVASFLMLAIAVFVASNLEDHSSQGRPGTPQQSDPIFIDPDAIIYNIQNNDNLLSPEIIQAYQRDGVIAVRGLLSPSLLQEIDAASRELVEQELQSKLGKSPKGGTQFFQVKVGLALHDPAFQMVALHSNISFVAAQLLELTNSSRTSTDSTTPATITKSETNKTVRMLRDIFLVKDNDPFICGWHTDDTGFWPATAAAPGVNAWIALDDMPADERIGGGFALAVESHVPSSWMRKAHTVTGSTQTFPLDGFRDASDMFANRSGSGTCNLRTAAPTINQEMEDRKRIYNVQKGDVIFHNRWLFHRTIPFSDMLAQKHNLFYRRYSVRYGPGSSIIPPGYGLELSVLQNADNGGRTADDVCALDGPWYPKAWPNREREELEALPVLMTTKMPIAEAARKERRKEMKPHLDAMRRQNVPLSSF